MNSIFGFDQTAAKRKLIRYKEDRKLHGYLQAVLTLTAFSIFAAFAIRPSFVSVLQTNNQKNELHDTNEKLIKKNDDLNKIKTLNKKYEEEFDLIDKALPIDPMEEDILITLQTIGAQNNVLINNINFANSGSGISGAQALNMQMALSGTYENLLGFITDVQNLLRVTTIDNVTFSPQGGSGLIKANMKLNSYYRASK